MNFDGFGERLRQAIGADKPYAFAKKCGVSESLLRKYLSGASVPSVEKAWAMAKTAKVSLDWLAGGEGSMCPSGSSNKATPSDEDVYSYIPLYDARCSAGHGAWNEGTKVLTLLAFTTYSLRKQGLTPSKLSAIRVDGDSMAGLLEDGDTVLIDHSRNQLEAEAVYVIRLDDHLYAKRLQRLFDGSVQIISENKAYGDVLVPKTQLNDLAIIGRVVWAGGWI
ncbi:MULTISPECIES: LexA family transcriptional regulator [Pseudomonas]|uniref:LexA family transcriptional regulator n=1 Tax=Pseudomonas TaxID=286 RepID=UPI001F220F6F|nr:helix-turn-helix transcriptional regulator [Pseudomonas fragi]MCF6763808.1 helix-turn-helix transcriptional regulator [Pseudomonas fragi]